MAKINFSFINLLVLIGVVLVSILIIKNRHSQNSSKHYERSELVLPLVAEYKLPFVKTTGNKITDANGQNIYLRGFQGLGFYPMPSDMYFNAVNKKKYDPFDLDSFASELNKFTVSEYDINEIKSTGANVIRLWFTLHEIEKYPFEYSKESLDLLEKTVNEFGDYGIYTIIVLGKIGQNPYEPSKPYRDMGIDFWENTNDIQIRSVKIWGLIGERFKNNPYIAGFDILNEPVAPSKETLHNYYRSVIEEIRKYDNNHIIILESDNLHKSEFQIGGKYDDGNMMASFHFYFPHEFTLSSGTQNMIDDLKYPGGTYCNIEKPDCEKITWNKEKIEEILKTAINSTEIKGIPIFIGEFGANSVRDNSGALTWIKDMFDLLNKYNLSYTYHNYRSNEDYGYYYIQKPSSKVIIDSLKAELAIGKIKIENLTSEQMSLLKTQYSYTLRPGIKDIVSDGFEGR